MEPEGSLPYSQQSATCPYPETDQSSTCTIPLLQHRLLILFSHVSLGLPSGFFLSGFPTKTPDKPILSPMHATYPAYLILLYLITQTIFVEQYQSISYSLYIFLHSPLRPKYSPQHPILKRSQTITTL